LAADALLDVMQLADVQSPAVSVVMQRRQLHQPQQSLAGQLQQCSAVHHAQTLLPASVVQLAVAWPVVVCPVQQRQRSPASLLQAQQSKGRQKHLT
jgi:hypothetical protein